MSLQACKDQLEQLQALSQSRELELRELTAAVRAEKAHVEQLQRQVSFAHEEAAGLRDEQKQLLTKLADAQSQASAARAQHGQLLQQHAELKQAHDRLQNSHEVMQDKFANLSKEHATRYINAEDEAERRLALNEHVTAIGQRIKELSNRHYFELPGLNAPEMVFMFVPIESAFVEALKADETLFQKAIEQNVLVATPTTLLTSLNIVRQLWRFEDQNKHTAELAERAGKVYDKLRTFLGSMDAIGNSLDKAQDAYRKARDQLVSGKANLVKQVSDFRQLGVAVKGELDETWVDRADLELTLVEHEPSEMAQ